MTDVTETKQGRDPWTDPDPQPEDFEEYLAELRPEDWQELEVDPNGRTIFIRHNDLDRWRRERKVAHARGELMPEEIEAGERERERLARQALEKDHDRFVRGAGSSL